MIKREEALLLFNGWHSAGNVILCVERRFDVSALLKGRVTAWSEEEMTVSTMTGDAFLKLRFGRDLQFEYGEPKDLPVPKPKEAVSMIGVVLPLRVTLPVPNTVPNER